MSFIRHTVESAPEASRRAMRNVERAQGHLPAAVALLAESPATLNGFFQASALFEGGALEPLARETVIMTVVVRNECHLCVALHTAKLGALGAAPALVEALRAGGPLDDPRLEAVRTFTLEVIATRGAVPAEAMDAFLGTGRTRREALEIVLGIGAYTISTFANRMVDAPLDEALRPHAWHPPLSTAGAPDPRLPG
ncbi:carboxymuconolactone decarboxylase family protein [Actinomadura parmotrematis]|uniref:Carboxymuconolactone decarboxylase family protein n=1 Tax=Actinomadura parmotrematis TaxID=2864039 RepID=A0ABS7FUS5_9ACTN|nr:hypothetical protein [Actinomadura parmotrematis]MBW8484046.1 hypothetical protein [Actinomadura parmotrematis]